MSPAYRSRRPAMDEDDERAVFRACCPIEGGMSLSLDGMFGARHSRSPSARCNCFGEFQIAPIESIPHSKAQSASVGATTQLMHLALSDSNIRRKRHENVMSTVMGSGPTR